MSELDELRAQLAELRNRVDELAERVTDTHTLAAHADRDVTEFREELRHQTRLINATRLDMAQLRDDVNVRITELGDQVTGFRTEVGQGMSRIASALDELIRRDGGQQEG